MKFEGVNWLTQVHLGMVVRTASVWNKGILMLIC